MVCLKWWPSWYCAYLQLWNLVGVSNNTSSKCWLWIALLPTVALLVGFLDTWLGSEDFWVSYCGIWHIEIVLRRPCSELDWIRVWICLGHFVFPVAIPSRTAGPTWCHSIHWPAVLPSWVSSMACHQRPLWRGQGRIRSRERGLERCMSFFSHSVHNSADKWRRLI